MTKWGETNNFTGYGFVKEIENYLGWDARSSRRAGGPIRRKILDYVIFNTKKPLSSRIAKYEKEGAAFVNFNKKNFLKEKFQIIKGSFLRKKGFIRHDPAKVASTLFRIIN